MISALAAFSRSRGVDNGHSFSVPKSYLLSHQSCSALPARPDEWNFVNSSPQRRMVRSFDGTPVDLDLAGRTLRRRPCGRRPPATAPACGSTPSGRTLTRSVLRRGDRRGVARERATRRRAAARRRRRAGDVAAAASTSRATPKRTSAAPDSTTNRIGRSPTGTPTPPWRRWRCCCLIEESGWQAALWGNFRHEARDPALGPHRRRRPLRDGADRQGRRQRRDVGVTRARRAQSRVARATPSSPSREPLRRRPRGTRRSCAR